MDILTADFETYYDKEYSLSKLTTEAYVRDPRFEVILVSVKVNDDEPIVYLGDDVAGFLAQFDWSRSAGLAHHAAFDGAILSWRYGIKPKLWLDTVSMARPQYMLTCGVSLDALTQRLNLGQKGTAVLNALGKRKADFTRQELEDYGAYCKQDVNLTYKLFNHLAGDTEKRELAVIDQTIRMFTEPSFVLDKDILREHLADVQTKKANLLSQITADKDALMSNDKFAEVLRGLGVDPPTKISLKTGKLGYAFAKTDPGMKELQEHDDPMVQAVVAARLGVKSTLEETRTQNFLAIAERGPLPIMLKYWGAHTGRFSGDDGMNLQNLPRGGRLRDALLASPGHVVIVSDSAQIEARIVAWLAGQDDLVEAFFNGRDVYAEFASEVYGRLITKETDPLERFIGKTCILGLGYGMGAKKLRATLASGATGPVVHISQQEAERIISVYRKKNHKIKQLWYNAHNMLTQMVSGGTAVPLTKGILGNVDTLSLPGGGSLRYPNLRGSEDGFLYDARKKPVKIYGGKCVENIVQHLAQVTIKEHMSIIRRKYRVVLQVHDEIVCMVPEAQAEEAKAFIRAVMSQPPSWGPDIPIACEIDFGRSYGDAK